MVLALQATHRWTCPNCPAEDVTHEPRPHTRFHTCPGLYGLTAPLVEAGVSCEVVAEERQDYVANERVQLDNRGRPVMAVVTRRDNGEDRIVFAPTATASIRS